MSKDNDGPLPQSSVNTSSSKPSSFGSSFHCYNGKVGRRLRSLTIRGVLLMVASVLTVMNLSAVREVIVLAPPQHQQEQGLLHGNPPLNQRATVAAVVASNKQQQLRSSMISSRNESRSNNNNNASIVIVSSAETETTSNNSLLNQPPWLFMRNRNAVASHVLQRDSNSLWTPLPQSLKSLKAIDRNLFPSSPPLSTNMTNVTTTTITNEYYLGFVRITKTGSSSLLNYLNRAKALQTFEKQVRDEFKESLRPHQISYKFLALPCVFGYHGRGNTTATTTTTTTNILEYHPCQHERYRDLIEYWTSSLRYLGINRTLPLRVSLDLTTIVREPVERYLSYFHYWRYIYPHWNKTAKEPMEHMALVSGDFPLFLKEVASQKRRSLNAAFQYEYFSSKVDFAIALVQDLRVLPLVNECFNASILLLADHYPRFFPLNEINFNAAGLSSNSRSSVYKMKNMSDGRLAELGLQPVQEFNLEQVKAEARETYLANDYRFYDASVSVFLRLLRNASNTTVVPPTVVRQCVQQIVDGSSAITTTAGSI